MLPSYIIPRLDAIQAGALLAGMTHNVKREPREMLDLFFMDPNFNQDTDAVLRVRSFWPGEDCAQLRSKTDTPDLVIFGTVKPVPGLFDGKFYWVEVLNPETLVYEGHFCGDRQIISNFVRSSHLTATLRYENGGLEDSYLLSTREHGFQGLKSATEKGEGALLAILRVAAAAKPLGAKLATSEKNLKVTERWTSTSEEALERVVFADLASPAFYQLLINMRAFAKTRGILEENMFIHEANGDAVYGWGVKEEAGDVDLPILDYLKKTVPLMERSTFGFPNGRHLFKGRDVFGKILTNASRIVGDQHYLEFMRNAKEQGVEFDIVYNVDATMEEVMEHAKSFKIKLQAEADAKKAADEEAAAKKAADEEAAAKKAADEEAAAKKAADDETAAKKAADEDTTSSSSMEVDEGSPKRSCLGLGGRSLSYVN